jgi:hypothetical protein
MSDTVWDILNRNLFFVKNAVKASEAKTSDKLDVYDPQTHELLLECREPDIGILVKGARLFGGRHDRGTPFNLVAAVPGSRQQVLRIVRGSATLSFGGRPIVISNHCQEIVGSLKRKKLALRATFNFSPEKGGEPFTLTCEIVGGDAKLFINEKRVASITSRWMLEHADYFREGRFTYAFSVSSEVPPNDRTRLILMAVAIAQHRLDV